MKKEKIKERIGVEQNAVRLFSRKEAFEYYAYFYDELVRLSEKPLRSTTSVRELKIPSHKLKKGYTQIHSINKLTKKIGGKEKFTIIDFLCWISVSVIIGTLNTIKELDIEFDFGSVMSKFHMVDAIDFNNLLRIADSRPDAVFRLFKLHGLMKERDDFDVIVDLWLKKVAEEKNIKSHIMSNS